MDKSWMKLRGRYLPQYVKGVEEFIEFARASMDTSNRIRCPCTKCFNTRIMHIDDVREHLLDLDRGMHRSYTRWNYHGENDYEVLSEDEDDNELTFPEGLQEALDDLHGGVTSNIIPEEDASNGTDPRESGPFGLLFKDAKLPLYQGCTKFTKLDFLVKLLHLKTINLWSNKSFNMLLDLIKRALPPTETLPNSHYEAKKYMRDIGLGYIPIHACKNDCMLFWKETEKEQKCLKCNEPRYKINEGKGKKIPHKVLRYFPLVPRLQRLYASRKTAEDMRWHDEKRPREEGVYRHPADAQAWKEFDAEHRWFADEARNVRLGIASDGFNPFGDMSNAYSMWPVMVVPYNLPPWKCMKQPFIFMSLLIPGPKAPGNEIDVYLRPLIDELKELWEVGVETYDVAKNETFRMHASLLWTINDFPAYGNLSGWSTKGYLACPVCNKDTCSQRLKNGKKICYMSHRRFLPRYHGWRTRKKNLFDGKPEHRFAPKILSGDDVLAQLALIEPVNFGKVPSNKKRKRPSVELNWTKRSIFFELPYWKTLNLRHNLDVMHIEKNICDNVIGTLMNIEGKTKDSAKARMDLQELGIRKELHLTRSGDKFIIPPACFTLSTDERKSWCEWFKAVKFPDGYASNISRCVNVKEGKITGLKSHDSHVLLQRLLPVVIRGYLNEFVSTTLIELGIFFKELCAKKLKLQILESLERDIAIILCKLEQIFPPAFFDVMIHLAIHLPLEAKFGGPVQYRWMYPIERFLGTLKKFVRNKARPEGSIAEAYMDYECISFMSMYLDTETRFNREERNYAGDNGQGGCELAIFKKYWRTISASTYEWCDPIALRTMHYTVLNNCEETRIYFEEHKAELLRQNVNNIDKMQQQQFGKWFEDRIQLLRHQKSPEATDGLYALACGPDPRVKRYTGCVIEGIRFHTEEREMHRQTQNSGVLVEGVYEGNNEEEFYGVIKDIVELRYGNNKDVLLFKCDWFDVGNNKTGIRKDAHFTSINASRKCYKDDPYVLASQVKQVFYLKDTKFRGDWKVIHSIKPRNVYDVPTVALIDEDVNTNDMAFQEEFQSSDCVVVQPHSEEGVSVALNRPGIEPELVDASAVIRPVQLHQSDITFINDDDDDEVESDDEDETLMEYCSDEDEHVLEDLDTDIED